MATDTTIKVETIIEVEEQIIQPYLEDPSYHYGETPRTQNSVYGKIVRWFYRQLEKVINVLAKVPANVYKVLIVIFFFSLLVLLASRAMDLNYWKKNETVNEGLVFKPVMAQTAKAWKNEILALEQKGDWRQALRLHFLYALWLGKKNNHLVWDDEMTNSEILSHQENTKFAKALKPAIHAFNIIWYGKFPLNERDYLRWKQPIDEFSNEMNRNS